MKFVLASHNRKKLAEMQEILRELGVEVVLQSDVGLDLEPEENGTTFAENAAIKAMAVMQASGLPAIADDSGLCVDALNGAPGIYSARYGGVDSDQARYRLLLEDLRGAGARTAHFHTAIVCCFPNGDRLDAAGDCFGTIAYAPQGDNGFGYDPVFFVPELRKTFATNLDTIVHVGKDGIGENLVKQVNDALEARELIKGRVLENSMYTAREAAEELKVAARCEVVQVIGSKFVLFRYQHNKDKRKIELEKDRKRSV